VQAAGDSLDGLKEIQANLIKEAAEPGSGIDASALSTSKQPSRAAKDANTSPKKAKGKAVEVMD